MSTIVDVSWVSTSFKQTRGFPMIYPPKKSNSWLQQLSACKAQRKPPMPAKSSTKVKSPELIAQRSVAPCWNWNWHVTLANTDCGTKTLCISEPLFWDILSLLPWMKLGFVFLTWMKLRFVFSPLTIGKKKHKPKTSECCYLGNMISSYPLP